MRNIDFVQKLNELEHAFLLVVKQNKKQARKLCRKIKNSNGQLKTALLNDK